MRGESTSGAGRSTSGVDSTMSGCGVTMSSSSKMRSVVPVMIGTGLLVSLIDH